MIGEGNMMMAEDKGQEFCDKKRKDMKDDDKKNEESKIKADA